MRLGVATTILVGAGLDSVRQIDFKLLFLFLMVITRIYAPFDQSLALIAELFVSQVSAEPDERSVRHAHRRRGGGFPTPRDPTLSLTHVEFAYDKEAVLHDVSFTAKEGEITALVGPSGSGKAPAPDWLPACGISPGVRLKWAGWISPRWTRRCC